MSSVYNGRSMTTHTLEVLHGAKSDTDAVTYTTTFTGSQLTSVTGGVAYAGRCVSLGTTGLFEFGVSGTRMGMWLLMSSNDPDVANYGGDPAVDVDAWVAIAPIGNLTAMVAAGAFELGTTEYDTAQTYLPNQLLTALTGTTLATCGVMTNQSATQYTNAICGVVSKGEETNGHGRSELRFWPVWLPAAA